MLTCIARNEETHDCASFEFAPPECQVLSGEVDSVSALGLTAEQQAAGYVLACSSTARGDASVAI